MTVGLTSLKLALREALLPAVLVSAVAHVGAIAWLATSESQRHESLAAGGVVALEVTLVEGPEQHAGADTGTDQAHPAATSEASAPAAPAWQRPAPEPEPQTAAAESAPEDVVALEPPKASAVAQPPAETASASVLVAPTPPPPKPAHRPAAPSKAAPASEEARFRTALATLSPDPAAFEDIAEDSDADAPVPSRVTGNAQMASRAAHGQSGEEPGRHSGGTRGAAPHGDNPKPVYPYAARRRGQEGRVLLHVEVSAAGAAGAISVAKSSGYPRLDRAALKTVRRWRFIPAQRNGNAVPAQVTVPIRFSLQ